MRYGYLVSSNKALLTLLAIDSALRLVRRPCRSALCASPKRILVSNWAHIGDVVTSLPTLRSIRENFPDAEIGLLVGRGSRSVVEGSGLYDNLHIIDHFVLNRSRQSRISKLTTYLADRKEFLRTASRKFYDLGIDLYPYFPPASPLFWKLGIPTRCGFTSGGFRELLTHPVKWSDQDKPVAQYGRDILQALWPHLGPTIGSLEPYYPTAMRVDVTGHSLPPEAPYVVLHVGAGASWKEWPESKWCELLKRWQDDADAPIIVLCGAGASEASRIDRISKHSLTDRTFLFVNRSWQEYVALIAGSAGLVCLESSAGHIAAAFSVPTVQIHSGVNKHRLWGPDNPHARILSAPTGCAPCHRAGCDAMACVRDVSPNDVFEALHSVMELASVTGARESPRALAVFGGASARGPLARF
jgi:ADP-heptose:LPS heptosyltransferase